MNHTCDHKHQHGDKHHHHDHHSISRETSSVRNIAIALSLNAAFALVELVGGIWTQSSAIQADAVHDLGDCAILVGALILQFASRQPPSDNYSFGLSRLSLLSSFLASCLLIAGSLTLTVTSFLKFQSPSSLNLDGMLALAILGVLVNGFAAWKIGHGHSLNEKALSWHMIEDLLGWVAVLISSIVMRFVDAPWLDPLLAVLISVFVLTGASKNLWASLRLLVQATPSGLKVSSIRDLINSMEGVKMVSAIRIWSLDGQSHVCTGQIELNENQSIEQWTKIRSRIDETLAKHGKFEVVLEPIFHHKNH